MNHGIYLVSAECLPLSPRRRRISKRLRGRLPTTQTLTGERQEWAQRAHVFDSRGDLVATVETCGEDHYGQRSANGALECVAM